VIVTFEGGEGTGKTSCARLLCEHLSRRSLPWLSLREPGGEALSEEIRSLFLAHEMGPIVELLLVLASRRRNIERLVEPALAAGRVVVIDRFVDSTLVYQGVLGGLGTRYVRTVMELTRTWMEPDITFVLDAGPDVALGRIFASDRFETRDAAYHGRIREAFLEIATEPRHRVVDASQGLDTVMARVLDAFDALATP